jgi:hypothetical protein
VQEIEQEWPGIGDAAGAKREDDVARRDDLFQEARRVFRVARGAGSGR